MIVNKICSLFRVGRKLLCQRFAPRRYAGLLFYERFHRPLNWEQPSDINEKINWLKFYSDTSMWSLLSDKYRVREILNQQGFSHLLVDFYGKWDSADEIDWDALPTQFVMKTNNGSGDVLLCRDKTALDTDYWTHHFNHLLHNNFSQRMVEPHYNTIRPCILAEQLLDSSAQEIPSTSMIDYKVWCFNGRPAYVLVCLNRTGHQAEVALFDLDWNFHPEHSVSLAHYKLTKRPIPRPQCLQEMLSTAAALSRNFPQVRVDFYVTGGRLYFGELTFTSMGGFMDYFTDEFLLELGQLCDIEYLK